MFSATWPSEVQHMASSMLQRPVIVNVGALCLRSNHDIRQVIEIVNQRDKFRRLQEVLNSLEDDGKVLIFVRTKLRASQLSELLYSEGIDNVLLSSSIGQAGREESFESFRSGKCGIMVATDVASRGLDVKDIAYVINFDFPMDVSIYVHRIGRTARAGQPGTAITFFSEHDTKLVHPLIEVLKEAGQPVPGELVRLKGVPAVKYQRSDRDLTTTTTTTTTTQDSSHYAGRYRRVC
eukprot:TRINITY_DN290_c0_g1_i8.p1 TRINITY_DN290_c0_g1~~TRINITY_DN290_c0_g1_i8.p1  ORF type:complete len:236 (-),score=28.06 TRINITY_DN290_c0_g1_i8:135-842(-)